MNRASSPRRVAVAPATAAKERFPLGARGRPLRRPPPPRRARASRTSRHTPPAAPPAWPAPLRVAADVSWPDCLQLVVLTSSKARCRALRRRAAWRSPSASCCGRASACTPTSSRCARWRTPRTRAAVAALRTRRAAGPDAASPAGGVGTRCCRSRSPATQRRRHHGEAFAAAIARVGRGGRGSGEGQRRWRAAARAAAKAAGPAGALRGEQAAAVKAAAAPAAAPEAAAGAEAASADEPPPTRRRRRRRARRARRRSPRRRGAAARGAEALWRRLEAAGVLVVNRGADLPRSVGGGGGAEWSGGSPTRLRRARDGGLLGRARHGAPHRRRRRRRRRRRDGAAWVDEGRGPRVRLLPVHAGGAVRPRVQGVGAVHRPRARHRGRRLRRALRHADPRPQGLHRRPPRVLRGDRGERRAEAPPEAARRRRSYRFLPY